MAGQVDLYYWVLDNITDLCTPSCIQSSSDWLENIYSICDGQSITIDSKMVPVESVAIRYADGIGLTCLTDMYELVLKFSSLTDPSQVNCPWARLTTKVRKPTQLQPPCQLQSVRYQYLQQTQVSAPGTILPLSTTTKRSYIAFWRLKTGSVLTLLHLIALQIRIIPCALILMQQTVS